MCCVLQREVVTLTAQFPSTTRHSSSQQVLSRTLSTHSLMSIFCCKSHHSLMAFIFPPSVLLTTRKVAWFIILVSFDCLSLYVWLSICQTITFERLDVGSSYLHIRYICREYWSGSYMKVISQLKGHRSRKQPEFLFRWCKLRVWRIKWCDHHVCHVTGSDHA